MCRQSHERTKVILTLALSAMLLVGFSGVGYGAQSDTDTSTVTFTITAPSYDVTFAVVDEDSQPVEGATVRLENGVNGEHTTGADGKVLFKNVPPGTYDYTVEKPGYVMVEGTVDVVDDDVTVNVTLEEKPPVVPSPVTPEYEVTITIDGEGSVVPSIGVHVYREGATVTFEAAPALGWMFREWYLDGEPTGVTVPEFTITVEADVAVKAIFVEPPVLVPYVEEIVDPEVGGIVEVPGVMTIAVPPGATENPVRVEVQVYSADDPAVADIVGPRIAVGGLVYEIVVTEVLNEDEYGERIREFFRDLILTFLYPPDEVDDPDDLLVHIYNEALGIWVPLPTLVDLVTGAVTVHLDHLTYFAIFEVPDRLTDIEGHWGEADILFLTAVGAVSGYPDLTFRPEELVTREQFARMLVDAAGLATRPVPRYTQLLFDDFEDISEWARPYVEAAVLGGLIRGFDDDTFRPQENVTRAQVAVMLSRALGLTPIGEPPFVDADEIPDWAAGHVAALSHLDIVRGYLVDGNYYFRPDVVTTRAEAAAFLTRYLEERLRR